MIKGKDIPKVHEDTSIKDVILEITSKRLGTTTVIDNDGYLTGVITDGDLRRLLERTLDIKDLIARDIMTKNPKVMKGDYLASFALQQMENFKITAMIIIDDENRPIGVIHLHESSQSWSASKMKFLCFLILILLLAGCSEEKVKPSVSISA